jgi:hypothetical protein
MSEVVWQRHVSQRFAVELMSYNKIVVGEDPGRGQPACISLDEFDTLIRWLIEASRTAVALGLKGEGTIDPSDATDEQRLSTWTAWRREHDLDICIQVTSGQKIVVGGSNESELFFGPDDLPQVLWALIDAKSKVLEMIATRPPRPNSTLAEPGAAADGGA